MREKWSCIRNQMDRNLTHRDWNSLSGAVIEKTWKKRFTPAYMKIRIMVKGQVTRRAYQVGERK